MKICITSTGPGLDSELDPRFGRCQYFLFIDPESMAFEAVDNSNLAAAGGAGIQSAQLVAGKGVETVITGQVGPNAFTTLQAAGIKILTGASGKVREVLEKYKKGQISSSAQGPTVRSHFGMGRPSKTPSPPPTEPKVPHEELKELKEQAGQMKDQLDRIMEKIERMETKK